MMRYVVLTNTMCGWENCWSIDGGPWFFDSLAEAQAELDDLADSYRDGMGLELELADYMIVPEDEAPPHLGG